VPKSISSCLLIATAKDAERIDQGAVDVLEALGSQW